MDGRESPLSYGNIISFDFKDASFVEEGTLYKYKSIQENFAALPVRECGNNSSSANDLYIYNNM